MIKEEGKLLLPRIHILPDKDLLSGPSYNRKIKVSVRKITRAFGNSSGLSMDFSRLIGDRKWKSAWLNIVPGRNSWYVIERIYWKCPKRDTPLISIPDVSLVEQNGNLSPAWIETDHYLLKENEKNILLSQDAWLNDNIMDAAQSLICKTLGNGESYQSVLNWQKKGVPFYPVHGEHIQIMHDGTNHWLLTFCSNDGRVQVCDSLRHSLSRVTKRCIKALYKPCTGENGKIAVTFLPVQYQNDGHCGLYAIAFAADILDGLSPMESYFDVTQMRSHLINCLENEKLTSFPNVQNHARVVLSDAINVLNI